MTTTTRRTPMPRWVAWVTWVAILAPLPYSLSRVLWAAGFGVGLADSSDLHTPGWISLYLLLLAGLTEATGLYAHAFLLRRPDRVPGWIPWLRGRPVRPGWVIAPLLAPIAILAVANAITAPWFLNGFEIPGETEWWPNWGVWGPAVLFWIWGPALAVATAAYAWSQRVPAAEPRHRVVVVGGGFGGLQAVRGLRRTPVDVTLVDRRNFHLFQPLLYQVATGALAAAEIATPLRGNLRRQRNARVVLGDVSGFDLARRRVLLGSGRDALAYDTLVVAGGAGHAYFGHDDWQPYAPGLKTLEDAIDIRARILAAFEAAELEPDPDARRSWLTFAVVGGGPTGVELAGQIVEIARETLRHDFRSIDPRAARVLLVETADRVLTGFPERLSLRAAGALERLGVTPVLERTVVGVDAQSVTLEAPDGGRERVPARTLIWAAGVRASALAGALAQATGGTVDRAGRVSVAPDLTLPGHPEVYALGDMVRVLDAEGRAQVLPGVAPAAMQQGRHAARAIRARLAGREPRPFRYLDKGNVATIGRRHAVLDLRGLQLTGTLAWLGYLVVHLAYLVGLQNRLLVLIRWSASFVTRRRGARLITEGGSAASRSRNPRTAHVSSAP